jgi:tRNA(fMet)-specific endonuclease VapC
VILLDTDHLTVLQIGKGERFQRLILRLSQSPEQLATTIVNVEEQMRGWLAALAKERRPERQVSAYFQLADLFTRFVRFHITLFDESAATIFLQIRTGRGHVGIQDLKIASIALANDALLLTANRKDFEQVPGLRFENWMD